MFKRGSQEDIMRWVIVVAAFLIFAFLQYTTGFFSKFMNWLDLSDGLLDFLLMIVLFCLTIAAILGILMITYLSCIQKPLQIKQQKITAHKSKVLFEGGKKEEAVLLLKWSIKNSIHSDDVFINNTIDWLNSILQSYGLDDSYLKDFKQRFMKYIDERREKIESAKEQGVHVSDIIDELNSRIYVEIEKEFDKFALTIDS